MAFIYQEHCGLCVSVYFYDFLLLINGKQIGNLARVQDTVYILQKSFVFDLSIG